MKWQFDWMNHLKTNGATTTLNLKEQLRLICVQISHADMFLADR